MKVVILCGGKGTRLKELTEEIPKPLVEIGGKPTLWHIMNIYSYYGCNDFIMCLGYKGGGIKRYFQEYESMKGDFTLSLDSGNITSHNKTKENWNITFAETGIDTETGGRIKKIEKYIKEDDFVVTYGDGLANINIKDLLMYHKKMGKIATMTCVSPAAQFGIVDSDSNGIITRYRQKPVLDWKVNGGFFVFNKKIFDYLNENSVLERKPFEKLIKDKQMCMYSFNGFWACMDTYKDNVLLNELWKSGKAPWKVWDD